MPSRKGDYVNAISRSRAARVVLEREVEVLQSLRSAIGESLGEENSAMLAAAIADASERLAAGGEAGPWVRWTAAKEPPVEADLPADMSAYRTVVPAAIQLFGREALVDVGDRFVVVSFDAGEVVHSVPSRGTSLIGTDGADRAIVRGEVAAAAVDASDLARQANHAIRELGIDIDPEAGVEAFEDAEELRPALFSFDLATSRWGRAQRKDWPFVFADQDFFSPLLVREDGATARYFTSGPELLVLSPDLRWLLVDGELHDTRDALPVDQHDEGPAHLAVARSGEGVLWTVRRDGEACALARANERVLVLEDVECAAFDADAKRLATIGTDGTVTLRRLGGSIETLATLEGLFRP